MWQLNCLLGWDNIQWMHDEDPCYYQHLLSVENMAKTQGGSDNKHGLKPQPRNVHALKRQTWGGAMLNSSWNIQNSPRPQIQNNAQNWWMNRNKISERYIKFLMYIYSCFLALHNTKGCRFSTSFSRAHSSCDYQPLPCELAANP